jgi:hypothetical protein
MSDSLAVLLNDLPVGVLTRLREGRLRFDCPTSCFDE